MVPNHYLNVALARAQIDERLCAAAEDRRARRLARRRLAAPALFRPSRLSWRLATWINGVRRAPAQFRAAPAGERRDPQTMPIALAHTTADAPTAAACHGLLLAELTDCGCCRKVELS